MVDALELIDSKSVDVIFSNPKLGHLVMKLAGGVKPARRRATVEHQDPSPDIASRLTASQIPVERKLLQWASFTVIHDYVKNHTNSPLMTTFDKILKIYRPSHIDVGSKEESRSIAPVQRIWGILNWQ